MILLHKYNTNTHLNIEFRLKTDPFKNYFRGSFDLLTSHNTDLDISAKVTLLYP